MHNKSLDLIYTYDDDGGLTIKKLSPINCIHYVCTVSRRHSIFMHTNKKHGGNEKNGETKLEKMIFLFSFLWHK